MRILTLLFSVLFVAQSFTTKAQNDLSSRFDTLGLKAQFDYVYSKSESYERYKVIKMSTFNMLKQNSLDSVMKYRSTLLERDSEITSFKTTIEKKDEEIKGLADSLEATTNSKNSMSFLGAELSKGLYNSIMWGLVLGLVVFVLILFFLFKRSHSVTNETKHRLAEVEEEYETHRKSALKREQKLARELMDERLKHKF